MYIDCAKCPKLGNTCNGPHFVSMPAADLLIWCKARKAHLGLTNQKLADMANMSKGTIDSLFGSSHADFKYETIRPLLQALIGGNWKDDSCPDPNAGERAAYEEKIRQLEKEIQWRDERIQQMRTVNEGLHAHMTDSDAQHRDYQQTMQAELKRKNRIIALLATLFGVCLAVIITALIIDRLNSNIGFFWLSGLFTPHGSGLDSFKETAMRTMHIIRG